MARTPPQKSVGLNKGLGREMAESFREKQGSTSAEGETPRVGKRLSSPGAKSRKDMIEEDKGTQSQGEDRETGRRRLESPSLRPRAHSIPDCSVVLMRQGDKEKRKRDEHSPSEENKPKKGNRKKQRGAAEETWESQYNATREVEGEGGSSRSYDKVRELVELLGEMMEEIRVLRSIATENQNTKVEIKRSSGILEDMEAKIEAKEYVASLMEVLENRDRGDVLNIPNQEVQRACSYVNAGTQTDGEPWRIRNERTVEGIRAKIAKCDDLGEVLEVASMEWPRKTYKRTRTVVGNPIWDNNERDIVLCIRGQKGLDEPIGKQVCRRFPEVAEAPQTEQVYSVRYEARLDTQNENTNVTRRTVTLVNIGETEASTFQALLKWKRKVEEMDIKKVAIPLWGEESESLRKLMECVFWDSRVSILLCETPKRGQNKRDLQEKEHLGNRKQERTTATGAIIVKAQTKSYADLLRQVKSKVDVATLGVEVRGVPKTRGGELLIEVNRDAGREESLQTAINECFAEDEGVTIRKGKRNDLTFQLRGVDVTTPISEIAETLRNEVDGKEGDISVLATRAGPDGNTVATVSAPRELASKLIERRKIRIGWSSCDITPRSGTRRCLRCWEIGHLANSCKGVDRTKLCLKCGKEGHKVQECRNSAFCPICNKEGHRADSRVCPAQGLEAVGQAGSNTRGTHSRKHEAVDPDRSRTQGRVGPAEKEVVDPREDPRALQPQGKEISPRGIS